MDNIRDFLRSKFGNKNLVKSSDGNFVTLEEKQKLDMQKAERLKQEAQENKVKNDIREALAFLNSPTSINDTKNNLNASKTKFKPKVESKKNITAKNTYHSNTPYDINIYYDIDVPLMEEHPRTPESDALDKYVKEATSIFDDSTQFDSTHTTSNQTRKNIEIYRNNNSQRNASSYDMDR